MRKKNECGGGVRYPFAIFKSPFTVFPDSGNVKPT